MPDVPDQVADLVADLVEDHVASDRACCAGATALYECRDRYRRAGLAQLVEHLICNQGVRGSNPLAGTILFNGLAPFSCGALSVVDTQWTHATDSTHDNGRF